MKLYKKILLIVNLVLILVYVNYSIYQKETHLDDSKLILIKLAPIDPRSLMQGDYMRLNYDLPNPDHLTSGYITFTVDENHVVSFVKSSQDFEEISENQVQLAFKLINGDIKIGAESYFFQEGNAKKFEKAIYGGLKVNENGNAILIGLYDKKFNKIE